MALYASGANLCHGKFRQSDPAVRTSQGIPTWASNIDFPMLRFADIVLLYAEALYKTGNESLARELVEEVRKRACTDTEGKLDESALNAMNSAYYKTDFMGRAARRTFARTLRRGLETHRPDPHGQNDGGDRRNKNRQ